LVYGQWGFDQSEKGVSDMQWRLPLITFSALTLAACGGVNYGGGLWDRDGRGAPSAHVAGIAYGSAYESYLTSSDVAYMSDAFLTVMNTEEGTRRDWVNHRTGAQGEIIAGEPFLQNVDYARSGRLRAPVGLETRWALEPAQGDYSSTSNTNVRLGASTSAPVVSTLTEGSVVEAIGSVHGAPWMLVARHGEVVGYMHTDFLEQREGGDVLLAGGAPRAPIYCRVYDQRLVLRDGPRDSWSGTACLSRNGRWDVQGARGPGV